MSSRTTLPLALLAVTLVSSSSRAEAPVVTGDFYGLAGEIGLGRLVFHGSGVDGSGTTRAIDRRGSDLGVAGGTYYGAGTMVRVGVLPTTLGSLMLGLDLAAGGGGVSASPRLPAGAPVPSSFGLARMSLDVSWALATRWLFLSYGASLGGRLTFVSLTGLANSAQDDSNAQVINTGAYLLTWFRPGVIFARFDGGGAYLGGQLMIEPAHPDFREYGLSLGVIAF